ncbi:hypothetical protein POG22_14220 [Geitlerinema sp. CS-897]|nr:hypothetical protein [Geitlerinema sp. CS-897]
MDLDWVGASRPRIGRYQAQETASIALAATVGLRGDRTFTPCFERLDSTARTPL